MNFSNKQTTMLKGFIFDMDGTLVDNIAYHFRSFDEFVKRKGLTLKTPFSLRFSGMHSGEIFAIVLGEEQMKHYTVKELEEGKEATYREIYSGNVEPINGLIELLQAAKEAGIKCAIGSSGCRDNVEFIINELGIRHLIDVSISGSDVTHGKPHPEIFQKAAAEMGLSNKECIVFEDAVVGIEAGRRAGSKCIGITTTVAAEALAEQGAEICVADYTSLSIKQLQELL